MKGKDKNEMTDVKFIILRAENPDALAERSFNVWYCKTLQNWKALAGIYGRDEYFELTYNGDEKELYLDVYKKSENMCLKG